MTRRAAPVRPPVGLTIATSDSGGGAGVQADLKTMEAGGVFGTSVLCATTAQNTRGVESVHVLPIAEIGAQLDAVLSDFDVGAAKTGMLATADVVEFVAGQAGEFEFPLVVDPVMVATSGDRLLEPDGEEAYEELIAEATVVTPNADEATVLTGVEIDGERTAIEAGEAIVDLGAHAALVKGGHVPGERIRDVLVTREETTTITHPRVASEATHGSGCTLASAIAAGLARGEDLEVGIAEGVELLSRAVRYPLDVGEGPGSVHHLVALRERAARGETAAALRDAAERLGERDLTPLLPEDGASVVGATPYAEGADEIAAVEGGITRASSGTEPSRGVRFGASEDGAGFLLAAREGAPELRFGLGCRFDERVERALSALDGSIVELERDYEERGDADERESTGRKAAVRRAFDGLDGNGETPVATIDRNGADGEALAWIVAPDSDAVVERTFAVLDALETGGTN